MAIPERRKKTQNGQILEVEEMHKCIISSVGNCSTNIRNIWSTEEVGGGGQGLASGTTSEGCCS